MIFGVFSWWPIVSAVIMSFQKTNLIDAADVGRPGQLRARSSATRCCRPIVRNTAWFALLALVFGYPVPLVAAVLMSELRRRKGLYSVLAYLPVVVPPVVAVLLWKFFYDPRPEGVFNTVLGWVGLGPFPWLQQRDLGDAVARARGHLGRGRRHGDHLPGRADQRARRSCTTPPRSTVRRSGARSGTSRCRSCAASCSSRFILQIIGTAQVFLEPFLFTNGGPNHATETVMLRVYNLAFASLGNNFGQATALSLHARRLPRRHVARLLPGHPLLEQS